jgi:hypothetical protein
MDSKTGLVIQFTGVFLIAVLSLLLRHSLKTRASNFWTGAWISLSFALFCLSTAFSYELFVRPLFGIYFLSEYVFGFLLIFGCCGLSEDFKLTTRHKWYFLPFFIIAVGLPFLSQDFNSALITSRLAFCHRFCRLKKFKCKKFWLARDADGSRSSGARLFSLFYSLYAASI